MSRRYFSTRELEAAAAIRPPGYLDELMRAAVITGPGGATFETSHAAYAALRERHQGQPQTRVRRTVTVEKATKPRIKVDMAARGPPLWAKLHRFTLTEDARDPAKLAAFLTAFGKEVPCGSCRREYRLFSRANPPSVADPFAWSVDLHNAVNEHLNKPTFTVDQARQRWS